MIEEITIGKLPVGIFSEGDLVKVCLTHKNLPLKRHTYASNVAGAIETAFLIAIREHVKETASNTLHKDLAALLQRAREMLGLLGFENAKDALTPATNTGGQLLQYLEEKLLRGQIASRQSQGLAPNPADGRWQPVPDSDRGLSTPDVGAAITKSLYPLRIGLGTLVELAETLEHHQTTRPVASRPPSTAANILFAGLSFVIPFSFGTKRINLEKQADLVKGIFAEVAVSIDARIDWTFFGTMAEAPRQDVLNFLKKDLPGLSKGTVRKRLSEAASAWKALPELDGEKVSIMSHLKRYEKAE